MTGTGPDEEGRAGYGWRQAAAGFTAAVESGRLDVPLPGGG